MYTPILLFFICLPSVLGACPCSTNNFVVVSVIGLNLHDFNREHNEPTSEWWERTEHRLSIGRSCLVRRKACRFSVSILFFCSNIDFYLFTIHAMPLLLHAHHQRLLIRRVVCHAVYKFYYIVWLFDSRRNVKPSIINEEWVLAFITIFTHTKLKWNCRRCVSVRSVAIPCHTVLRHCIKIIKRDSDFVIVVVVVFVENVEAAKDNKYVRSKPHEVLLTKTYRRVGCIFEQRLLLAKLMTNNTQNKWVRENRGPCSVPLAFEQSITDNVFTAVHIYLPTVPNGMWKMVAGPRMKNSINVQCRICSPLILIVLAGKDNIRAKMPRLPQLRN